MRLLNAILYDIKFQIRHGFYYAYIFVSIIYIIILKLLPESIMKFSGVLIVFSDPSVLGVIFIGGIFLLEKSQNTLESLFITPFKAEEYVFSKVISLSLISVLSSLAIMLACFGISVDIIPLLLGVTLSSIFYTLMGFTLAVYAKNLNMYLLSMGILIVFILPMLEYLKLYSTPVFYMLPGKASLLLIDGAVNGLSMAVLIYSTVLLLAWSLAAFLVCLRVFRNKIILRIGG